ncbi:hypothetical protein DSCW_03790 [Desulfosarcina widdelii]|uniref:SGNH hydrolase-type esterase domain-containing protein n=1 Tax=Desulfosarcina widdelii TaxID=947919 RepID=A0A5K7YT03_9BACT|nr:hypothetical protein [Desulfosarcina widdelii]BBO72962.1 hypothetical protein DSCW_03790 [Desulfosarcina widdelii]
MEQKKVTYNSLKDIPDAAWEKLSQKKIYFGHQSVGFNIMDGVEDLKKEYPQINLKVVETKDSDEIKPGILAHSRVGKNTDPKSKIDDFSNILDNGIGRQADAAALKFCYVDMKKESDIPKIFEEYKYEIEKIKKAYPDFSIVHFTEPLTVSKTTWKTWLKKILGKKDFWEFNDNIKRNEYNELLISEYQGKDPILDIAAIESTKPDGTRQSFELNGKTYYSMYPGYTTDGGHLNELGRKRVAEQLILLMVNL